jgi:GH15 family glucan-1,4-alpha-glucosidase
MFRDQSMIPLALSTIKKNTTSRYNVIAAPEGPGTDHKEYLHVWPRDAIFVALELKNFDRRTAEKVVENVLALPTDNGLFYQRYELDGKPDPRAWCNGDGSRQLDQDALRFVAVSKFPGLKIDLEKLKESYTALLNQIKDKKTTTDVWEQKKGYFFYTTAALIWGLKCAEKIIPGAKDQHKDVLKQMMDSLDSFYDEKLKSFVKSPSEKIIDLEVVLGLNILFESGLELFNTKEELLKVLSTLKAIEKELCVTVGKSKIPIRYKNDFWNGESVGANGSGRPWPMGAAMISQTYNHVADAALTIGEYELAREALENVHKWLGYVKSLPNIHVFPEQIDYDGSLPKLAPKPLTWCAAEVMKAERLYLDITERIAVYSTTRLLSSLYAPKLTVSFVLN